MIQIRRVFTDIELGGSLRLQTPVTGSRSVLAMSVHPTYVDLAMPGIPFYILVFFLSLILLSSVLVPSGR